MATWQKCVTLGDRLKWAREERLNLRATRDLADAWAALPEGSRPQDTSFSSVNKYESNVRAPRADYVHALCELAKISPSWLVSGIGGPDDLPGEAERKLAAIRAILTSNEDEIVAGADGDGPEGGEGLDGLGDPGA